MAQSQRQAVGDVTDPASLARDLFVGERSDVIVAVLATLGKFAQKLAQKAELARIGRHYATESMLALDPETGRYDAAATHTLFAHYQRLVRGEASDERGDHAVF